MNQDIQAKIDHIKEKTTPIFKKYSVRKAGIFGSVVRGEDNTDSDIDLLIDFEKIGFREYLEMKRSIEQQLQRRVDLVQYKLIKPALKKHILPYEISIYEENS